MHVQRTVQRARCGWGGRARGARARVAGRGGGGGRELTSRGQLQGKKERLVILEGGVARGDKGVVAALEKGVALDEPLARLLLDVAHLLERGEAPLAQLLERAPLAAARVVGEPHTTLPT